MTHRFEAIGGGVVAAVDDHCRISEDGLLLARFAAPTPTDTACDLGSGNGIIPLYWCRRRPPAHITAVEREAAFAQLAQAAITRCALEERITLLCCDWNDETAMPQAASMSLVTCNPPYFPFGASRPSPDLLRAAARQEDTPALLEQLCRAAARLLTPQGRFCLCHRSERLADVFCALKAASLTPVRLQCVQTHDGAAPWLVLIEAAHTGTLRILPPLITQARGTHTAVYKNLYR